MEQKYKHLKHKYEDLKQSSKAEVESLTETLEADIAAKEKEVEKLKFNMSLSPSKDSVEALKADNQKLKEKVRCVLLIVISDINEGRSSGGWFLTPLALSLSFSLLLSFLALALSLTRSFDLIQVSRLENAGKNGGKSEESSAEAEMQVNESRKEEIKKETEK